MQIGQLFSNHLCGVDQTGEQNTRGSMLIVMKNGNADTLELLFDLETSRCRNIFQIDTAENGGDPAYRFDDLVRILRVEADRPGVDIRELLT